MTQIFDLEQKLLQFANIIDDLKLVMEKSDKMKLEDTVSKIVSYYEFKFDDLWACFEECCKDYHETKKTVVSKSDLNELNSDNTPKWL